MISPYFIAVQIDFMNIPMQKRNHDPRFVTMLGYYAHTQHITFSKAYVHLYPESHRNCNLIYIITGTWAVQPHTFRVYIYLQLYTQSICYYTKKLNHFSKEACNIQVNKSQALHAAVPNVPTMRARLLLTFQ